MSRVSFDASVVWKENSSTTLRKTPHVSKKPRVLGHVDENAPDDWAAAMAAEDGVQDSPTVAESNKESLNESETMEATEEEAAEAEEEEEVQEMEDDKAWQAIVQDIESSPDTPAASNLSKFRMGLEQRNACEARLHSQQGQQPLTDLFSLIDAAFDILAGPIRASKVNTYTSMETSIVKQAEENALRRAKLQAMLEEHKLRFDERYVSIMAELLQKTPPVDGPETMAEADNEEAPPEAMAMEWGDLLQDAPTRESLEAFLQSRDMFQGADEQFGSAMDEIRADLTQWVERIRDLTAEVYETLVGTMDNQHADIQQHMASNLERRREYEQELTARAQEAQNFFQTLLSRVSSFGNHN